LPTVLDARCALHERHEVARDRRAEAGPAVHARDRVVGLRERLEDRRLLVLGDADAGVVHLDAQRARRGVPGVARTRSVISPFSVNLTAFDSRLSSTWRMWCWSPANQRAADGSISVLIARPL
jgi:hypothetical protein